MKPPDEMRNGGPKAAATHENPAKDSVALAECVNFLRGQWLRHDVLYRALGNDADKQAALRLGRFLDAIKEVQSWQP